MSKRSARRQASCPDCSDFTRRDFLKTSAGAVLTTAAAAGGIVTLSPAGKVWAEPAASAAASSLPETLVAQLYSTLTDQQRSAVCFDFDHPKRKQVDNNWFITDHPIEKFFNKDQQQLIKDIFIGIHNPEYARKVLGQVEHDNESDGGFGRCTIAMFGKPKEKFEFVFTGRHVTRRCDGNSVEGAAFGGPIFYGHAAESFNEKPNHPGNVYWYQAVRANEVFSALNGKQREMALRTDARPEAHSKTVELRGDAHLGGIPMTELTADQKDLVRKVMSDVLAPFRKADADEAMKLIQPAFDELHLSYFKNMDIGNDNIWDVWQIEGPNVLWYFRGAPHVHTWVHIRERGKEQA